MKSIQIIFYMKINEKVSSKIELRNKEMALYHSVLILSKFVIKCSKK